MQVCFNTFFLGVSLVLPKPIFGSLLFCGVVIVQLNLLFDITW